MKRLLMIAYHFPPLAGSSGIQRSLRFAQHLPSYGWQPAVLTVNEGAYERTSPDLLDQLPAKLELVRAFALDASRHLSIGGRYPGFLARPDRWLTWLLAGVPAGLAMIRRNRPAAIWSTYPIPSAHLLGYALAKITGLPWIADFRDPMAHDGYPADSKTWQSYLRTEKKVFSLASRTVFSTPGAARMYQLRYADKADWIRVIENGYEEATFKQAELNFCAKPLEPLNPGKLTFLHSGIVYPEWRNPRGLFIALQSLLASGAMGPSTVRLRFRAPMHDRFLGDLAQQYGLASMVEIMPPIPYEKALSEMMAADALLVLQSVDCNDQIPAKVYEYLRASKPILGLTDPAGDTAALLKAAAVGPICALEAAPEAIAEALEGMLKQLRTPQPLAVNTDLVNSASRESRTAALANLLDEVIESAGPTAQQNSNLHSKIP